MFPFQNIPKSLVVKYLNFSDKNKGLNRSEVITKLIIFDFVIPILRKYKHNEILEIGCGQGIHGALLSLFGNVKITDLAQTESWMGDVASVRKSVLDGLAVDRVEFKSNDGLILPYPDCFFDIVYHNSVIEHVPDVVAFNSEIKRVLKPGGLVLCITGTRLLCIFRLFRYYLCRQPLQFFINMRKMSRYPKIIRLLVSENPPEKELSISSREFYKIIPRLSHYLKNPAYNEILIRTLATESGLSVNTLLSGVAKYLETHRLARVYLYLLPVTHGQHYRGIWHEYREWGINNWLKTFKEADLIVVDLMPYRFQHLLEWTPFRALNVIGYLLAIPIIRVNNKSIKVGWSSEFILVAKKK